MSTRFLLPGLLFTAALAAPSAAQYPADAVALHWSVASGGAAGAFCWGFQCAPDPTTVSAGDAVTLLLRGDPNAAYVVGISASATSCIPIPGISHSLVLDLPIYVAFAGTLDELSPILSCPSGQETINLSFPSGVPPGSAFALQAVILPFSGFAPPSLTQAIVVTVT